MARRSLIIGINSYGGGSNDLHACVADAEAMTAVLARHKDKEKNFDCLTWLDKTDKGEAITRSALRAALASLFTFDGDVLLYFSGHGFLSATGGLLCTSDAAKDDWGVPMQEVVNLAIKSNARQILIILDCCHAGDLANSAYSRSGDGTNPLAVLRENMTVIAASRADEGYCSGQSHPFRGGMKVIAWRHEPVSHFFSYRSSSAQFC